MEVLRFPISFLVCFSKEGMVLFLVKWHFRRGVSKTHPSEWLVDKRASKALVSSLHNVKYKQK